ncbi:MAG: hypothetical protein IKY83_05025 [Proteobacteria bacterium]|nr:hypothetical protein [Pseudomonadota bacterium]
MRFIPWVCVFGAIVCWGCDRRPDSVADIQPDMNASASSEDAQVYEGAQAGAQADGVQGVGQLEKRGTETMALDETPMKWRYIFMEKNDPEAMAVYAEAEKLVKDMRTYEGALDSGKHLGSWYILSYPDPPMPELMPTDVSGPTRDVFLVDMKARKAVQRGDWAAAGPFFVMLALYEDSAQRALPPENRRVADINLENFSAKMLASFASLVAFGHQLYWHEPVAEKTPEGALVIRYDVPPKDASVIAKHCRLTVTDGGVTFESEDYHID